MNNLVLLDIYLMPTRYNFSKILLDITMTLLLSCTITRQNIINTDTWYYYKPKHPTPFFSAECANNPPLVIRLMQSWWRYYTAKLFALSVLRKEKPRVDSRHQRPVMWSVYFVFDVEPKKLLKSKSSCRWFETQWRSCLTVMIILLWRSTL